MFPAYTAEIIMLGGGWLKVNGWLTDNCENIKNSPPFYHPLKYSTFIFSFSIQFL